MLNVSLFRKHNPNLNMLIQFPGFNFRFVTIISLNIIMLQIALRLTDVIIDRFGHSTTSHPGRFIFRTPSSLGGPFVKFIFSVCSQPSTFTVTPVHIRPGLTCLALQRDNPCSDELTPRLVLALKSRLIRAY